MKSLLVLLILMTVALPSIAGDRTIRDRNGTIIGTWHDRANGGAEFRDRNGTLKATRERRGNGDVVYRDRNGTVIGTEEK